MTEVTQNQLAQIESSVSIEQIRLTERIGALKATEFVRKLVTVTTIKMLAEIKEAKQYKGLKIILNEELVTSPTWDQFCQHIGLSREKVDEDIRNLNLLGEDFLETSQKIGVGYRELRKLRQLPESDREVVINGEAVKTEDRESLIDLIEEMSAKHAKEKDQLKARVADLESSDAAKEQIIKTKDQKNNELLEENTKLKSPVEIQKRQESEAEQLQKQALQLMQKAVLTFLDAASQFNIDMNAAVESCMDPFVVEQYEANIRMTYQSIAQRCNDAGLPIDFAQMVTPDWLTEVLLENETHESELQESEA